MRTYAMMFCVFYFHTLIVASLPLRVRDNSLSEHFVSCSDCADMLDAIIKSLNTREPFCTAEPGTRGYKGLTRKMCRRFAPAMRDVFDGKPSAVACFINNLCY